MIFLILLKIYKINYLKILTANIENNLDFPELFLDLTKMYTFRSCREVLFMVNYGKTCTEKNCNADIKPLYHRGENKNFETINKSGNVRGIHRSYRAYYCPKCKDLKWLIVW